MVSVSFCRCKNQDEGASLSVRKSGNCTPVGGSDAVAIGLEGGQAGKPSSREGNVGHFLM